MAAPDAIRARLEQQGRYPYIHGVVRLTVPQLAVWLALGIEGSPVRAVGGLRVRQATTAPSALADTVRRALGGNFDHGANFVVEGDGNAHPC